MALYDRTLAEQPLARAGRGLGPQRLRPGPRAHPLRPAGPAIRRQDLIGNRIKRILTENPALVRANRVGIGGRDLPHRTLPRSEYRERRLRSDRAARRRPAPPRADLRPRHGSIFTVLSVPVYVHGERWGASVIGWDPDSVAT